MAGGVPAFIDARRSIRAFRAEPVPRRELDRVVEAACLAPAPHHSRPWRWVIVDTHDAKASLASGMGARWRTDLERDGVADARIDCWVAAPIFCPDEARDALSLPADWLPHALVLVGRPDPAYEGRARPPVPLDDLRAFR